MLGITNVKVGDYITIEGHLFQVSSFGLVAGQDPEARLKSAAEIAVENTPTLSQEWDKPTDAPVDASINATC